MPKIKFIYKFLITVMLIIIPGNLAFAKTNLSINATGSAVKTVQEKLLKLNYPIKKVTGFYDKDTYLAVKEFQRNNNLTVTGKVDDQTMSILKKSTKKLTPTSFSAKGTAILETGKKFFGTPYVFGGTTPKGFDCSGFTQYVFRKAGVSLPRTSAAQGKVGTKVSRSELRAGDLVMFPGHVGIYIGSGKFIHSPSPGKSVRIDDLSTRKNFLYGRRVN